MSGLAALAYEAAFGSSLSSLRSELGGEESGFEHTHFREVRNAEKADPGAAMCSREAVPAFTWQRELTCQSSWTNVLGSQERRYSGAYMFWRSATTAGTPSAMAIGLRKKNIPGAQILADN